MFRLFTDKPVRDSAFKNRAELLAGSYFPVDFMEARRRSERVFNATGRIARG